MRRGAFVGFLLVVALLTTGLYHLLQPGRALRPPPPPVPVAQLPPAPPAPPEPQAALPAETPAPLPSPAPAPGVQPRQEPGDRQAAVRAHLRAGRLDAAAALLNRDGAARPGDRELRIDLARRLVGAGRHDEAIRLYRLALGDLP